MTQPLLLGSSSPRRQEILSYFKLPFDHASPGFDESSLPFEGDPEAHVKALTLGKLDSLLPLHPDRTILTADTIVYRDGIVYGKPRDHAHAAETLATLSGQWHTVYTALAVHKDGSTNTAIEATRVLFHEVAPERIEQYLNDLHCDDKAGAYLIQGAGSVIVSKIEGCYYNVVGLPLTPLQTLLKGAGIDLWDHLG